jgi:heptosyltransferase-2
MQLKATSARTLIIAPNWIGDSVMAQPLLQLIRQQHPERPIDVLCTPGVAAVWQAMDEVHQVLETNFRHGELQLRERWELARRLRRKNYQEAYILPNTLKFALIPWLAGIPRRIGYKGESRYGLINIMHQDDKDHPRPMIPFYAALASSPETPVGKVSDYPRPRLAASEEQINKAFSFCALHREWPLVVFAPGAEFGSAKRWPAAHYAALADLVRAAQPYAQIALLGSSKDMAICEKIVGLAPGVRNLAGITKLGDAVALIAAAEAVVANDSGLLHIAAALNRPVIGLYGPTDPDHAPPVAELAKVISLRLECAPCKERRCPLRHRNCMRKMLPEQVWGELKPMLKLGQ